MAKPLRANAPDTLIDDFVAAMNVARAGKRIVYEPTALAWEDSVAEPAQEFRRRVRTAAGGFQSLFEGCGRPRMRQWLLWSGYFWHKALRWLSPWLLLAMFLGSAAALAARPSDRVAAAAVECRWCFICWLWGVRPLGGGGYRP